MEVTHSELVKKGKLSLVTGETAVPQTPFNLRELVRQDPDVLEFFRIIHEHDMREKAVELIERRMTRKDG